MKAIELRRFYVLFNEFEKKYGWICSTMKFSDLWSSNITKYLNTNSENKISKKETY